MFVLPIRVKERRSGIGRAGGQTLDQWIEAAGKCLTDEQVLLM
jgi:hypothetical protein